MNRYLVLRDYTDPVHGERPAGSFVDLDEKQAQKLIKQGVLQLSADMTMVDVAFRYNGLNLELYNTRTGRAMLRFNRNGILDVLVADLAGDVTGSLTGNVKGDVTGALAGSVTCGPGDKVTGPVEGNVTGDVTGNLTGQVFGGVATYDADGPITLTNRLALLDGSEASCDMTLADGTDGQTITIKAIDVTESCTVAPANFADGASISLPAGNDAVTLMFDGTDWQVVNLNGTAAIMS